LRSSIPCCITTAQRTASTIDALDEKAIACGLDDAALVLGHERIDQLLAMALEGGERPFFVGAL
jgi:hypothetical protein